MTTTVQFVDDERVCIGMLHGELDLSSVRDLGDHVLDAVSRETLGLVLDLSGVRYIDSTGVSLLFDLHRALEGRRQRLSLVVPPDSPLRRLLHVTALPAVITVCTSMDEAREAALSV